jgi:hypothetical protein
MEHVIYCDESRHDNSATNRYMAIGGLWVPRSVKDRLSVEFRLLRERVGLRGEVKWSKVSAKRLDGYKELVGFFFGQEDLRFRAIVVDQSKLDVSKYHGNDRELGFYKFYYEMLVKWLLPENQYLILLDHKQNKGADRYRMLRRVLENATRGKAWITDLTIINSHQSHLAQLTDLLTGATASEWCGVARMTAKGELAAYIGQCRGASLRSPNLSPSLSKFNVFAIDLQ